MSEKLTGRQRAVLVNICILAALVWCYFVGYPLKAILISGVGLLALANTLMYFQRRR